ncbi:hypothetical protein AK830_g3183 [Neonectria ditissima]|uniref:Chromo domain-containing protein n=1 Tax=Neonectria ditissima TaxID=78410 RepID=A0A0P7BPQ7_9HYPO|nr:hypothetical protein AK830_g3183 [Neonectria ditissima]
MSPSKKNEAKSQTVFYGRETAVRREDVTNLRGSIEQDVTAEGDLVVSDLLSDNAGSESESPSPSSPSPPSRKGVAATRKRARSSPSSPPPKGELNPATLATPSKRQRRADETAVQDTPRRSARRAAVVTSPAKAFPTKAKRGRSRAPAAPKRPVSQEEWEVEEIVDSQVDTTTKEHFYRVKWKGFPHKDNTWEPRKNLTKCKRMITAFEKGSKKQR